MIHGVVRAPAEVIFGCGAGAALPAVLGRYGTTALVCSDAAVLAQPATVAALDALVRAEIEIAIFGETEPELPLACVDRAVAVARAMPRLDVIVGLGGGSSIDLAKIVSLLLVHGGPLDRFYGESQVTGACLPVVAVPTTAGTGSEVTPVAVVADPARELKVGVSSSFLVPAAAICDPELTLSCPASVTAFSGIDALCHSVEAFTAARRPPDFAAYPQEVFRGKNDFSDVFALTAVRNISGALERAVANGADLEAREAMLYGSLCAGLAFGVAGTAGAHALQYAVGAATHTPHGLGVGLLLPFVLSFTRPACEPELVALAAALGLDESSGDQGSAVIDEIRRIALAIGLPPTLEAIGVDLVDLPRLADQALGVTRLLRNSPRLLDGAALMEILNAAHRGTLVGDSLAPGAAR